MLRLLGRHVRLDAVEHVEIARAIAEGLVRPVRWVETLRAIAARGVTDLVVAAPSRVVRALARRTLGATVTSHGVDAPLDLDALTRR